MLHVLFISYDGMTDPLGQSQVLPYLIGLTRHGYRFSIISCEKQDKFAKFKDDIEDLLAAFPIEWIPIKYHKKPPVISGMFDLYCIKRTATKLYRKDPFDMVHTRSGIPSIAGLWVKKRLGIPFLNDIRDFFADSRVDSGQWNQKNPLYKFIYRYFKMRESQQISNADGIVCLSQKARVIISQHQYFRSGIPIDVIPCSVDMSLFNPAAIRSKQKGELMGELGIGRNDIVFTYLGSTGSWYLTDEMFCCFKAIWETIPEARLLIISPDDPEKIREMLTHCEVRMDRVSITSAVRNQIPALLSLSQYSIFFIKPCHSKQASSPTKLGEIMSMGIPVITNSGVGDVREVVNQYEAGIVLDVLNQETFKKLAVTLRNRHFDGQQIRAGAAEYFNLENAVLKYREIYDAILERDTALQYSACYEDINPAMLSSESAKL